MVYGPTQWALSFGRCQEPVSRAMRKKQKVVSLFWSVGRAAVLQIFRYLGAVQEEFRARGVQRSAGGDETFFTERWHVRTEVLCCLLSTFCLHRFKYVPHIVCPSESEWRYRRCVCEYHITSTAANELVHNLSESCTEVYQIPAETDDLTWGVLSHLA
ncbi:hypothetical protein AXG93_3960s1310 [Marchantia polymorpha subsp. ruderalis]|uniref:Uncharacterized protein n=1 Tax=Marchantia polymorpha subsp. ruderalis TaxID=1480154 RepID=A0A176VH98_MARPO|nr:hypothetical protein AXG93_3960s1310 [Marchantia polymorpha subsp. ruderalis]